MHKRYLYIYMYRHLYLQNIEDISFLRTLATKVIDRFGYMPARVRYVYIRSCVFMYAYMCTYIQTRDEYTLVCIH